MMGLFINISVSTQHPPWRYLGVGIIQLVLLVVICLVFLMDMVKLVWTLGPPTLPTKNLVALLMVMILFYHGVENIHP